MKKYLICVCHIGLFVSSARGFSLSVASSLGFDSSTSVTNKKKNQDKGIALKISKSNQEIANIRVIYESEHILAIDKPPHIPYHDDLSNGQKGVLSCVRQLQLNEEIEYQGRLYGVHRLDRVTSGILLFAKSSNVARDLSESFKRKTVSKYYVALSAQKPKKKKQGWVKGDMVPSRRKSWKLTDSFKNPAITRFFTAGLGNCAIRIDDRQSLNEDSTVLSTSIPKTMILYLPHTGKTHQLRVASKSLGLPILGDPIYSNSYDAKEMARTYLHALALQVTLNGESVTIYNPPTSWFESEELMICGEDMKQVLFGLITKHCECSEILSLVSNAAAESL